MAEMLGWEGDLVWVTSGRCGLQRPEANHALGRHGLLARLWAEAGGACTGSRRVHPGDIIEASRAQGRALDKSLGHVVAALRF
jgi:hypothetical protein